MSLEVRLIGWQTRLTFRRTKMIQMNNRVKAYYEPKDERRKVEVKLISAETEITSGVLEMTTVREPNGVKIQKYMFCSVSVGTNKVCTHCVKLVKFGPEVHIYEKHVKGEGRKTVKVEKPMTSKEVRQITADVNGNFTCDCQDQEYNRNRLNGRFCKHIHSLSQAGVIPEVKERD